MNRWKNEYRCIEEYLMKDYESIQELERQHIMNLNEIDDRFVMICLAFAGTGGLFMTVVVLQCCVQFALSFA